jgi:hypothetical protein
MRDKEIDNKLAFNAMQIVETGISHIIVCSPHDDETTLEYLNEIYPSGTSGGWKVSHDAEHRPVECFSDGTKMHYLFIS